MIPARLRDDGTVVEVLRDGSEWPLAREVDWARVDATTEEEIAAQIAEDEAEAMRDAAAYPRRVRRKVGLSKVAFARRIGVPVDTVRNWGAGQARAPQGPALALLRIIDRAPKRRCMLWTRHSRDAMPFRFDRMLGIANRSMLGVAGLHNLDRPRLWLTRARTPTVAWTSRRNG